MRPRPKTRPRKQPTQERSHATVTALLDATARVLLREGYDRASTNRIAQVAGVNIGSLYQYFPGKDALVAALIDRHLDEISRVLGAGLAAAADAPVAEAVRAIVSAHVQIHATNPTLQRVLILEVPRVERLNPIVRFRAELVRVLAEWLAARRVELAIADTEFAAFALVHTVDALTQAAVMDHPRWIVDGTLVDKLSKMVLAYLEGLRD
jgi:AcrR family transcriptional regulator